MEFDQVIENTIKDPNYNPYCMPCPGLQRMRRVEAFWWKCPKCGAQHDVRALAKRYIEWKKRMEGILPKEEFERRKAELLDKRFPLLKHGGVTLVDVMGSDKRIVDAARTTSKIESKGDKEDRNLIRYLMRHRHSTPVEFPVVEFLIECPMDLWRQFIRHRTASVNEFSTRYSEAPDINDTIEPDAWRLQSKSNRQGSSDDNVQEWPEGYRLGTCATTSEVTVEKQCPGGYVTVASYPPGTVPTPGHYLSQQETELHEKVWDTYEERLKFGVANEVARKDLCLSTYTKACWQANLHNILHLLGLRMDKHAQWEIRQYANKMFEILQQLFPVTMQAFLDYRLNALTLTALDQVVIANMVKAGCEEPAMQQSYTPPRLPPYEVEWFLRNQHPDWVGIEKCRERDECLAKLQAMNLVRMA